LAAPTRAPPWAPSSWAASMGVDTPAKPRGVQTATGIAPYPDQQGRGSRIQSRRPRGLQRQTGPGRGQRVMHGVHADVTRRVHVHCQPRDPRHSPDIPLLWQFPSARRHPKSGGRPPTSTRRQSKTRKKWSKSCRKWAKSCRYSRLDHVYTKGLISELVVLPDSTTDHRPVMTTVRAGSHAPGVVKLVSLKRETKF
jgi:hypothetical protein